MRAFPHKLFVAVGLIAMAACGTDSPPTAGVGGSDTTTTSTTTVSSTAPSPTTTVQVASTPAVGVIDGRLVTFSTNDGQQTGVLYDGPLRVRSFSMRRTTTGAAEIYAVLESTDRCQPRIHRIIDGNVSDTGIVGIFPSISPDGRTLAYETQNLAKIPEPGFCPWSDLVVRDLATGVERQWTLPMGSGIRWMVWSSDSRQVVVHLGAEAYSGDTYVLDTKSAPVADFRTASTPVPGLQAHEWIGRPISVADGVFVSIYCCRDPNQGLGIEESVQFGVLNASGQLRRITTTKEPGEMVVAVDPSASYILLANGQTNSMTRANIDGTNRVLVGTVYGNILWQ